MSVGEPSEINDDGKVVDRYRTVFPEACDQNGDSEKKLVVTEEKHQTLDDGSPEIFALATDADPACVLQMVRYPVVDRIILIAAKDGEKVSDEDEEQVRKTGRYEGYDYLWAKLSGQLRDQNGGRKCTHSDTGDVWICNIFSAVPALMIEAAVGSVLCAGEDHVPWPHPRVTK